jgi:hypothetical protein
MKKNIIRNISIIALFFVLGVSCDDNGWFEREPKNIITEDQVWNDSEQILSLLANFYDRMPTFAGVFKTQEMTDFDDAMWAGHFDQNGHNNITAYKDDFGRYWDYELIRDINLALENIEKYSEKLTNVEKAQFSSELRFIRAYVYFELVKRMGGVPLVTIQLIYDFSGDPTPLQVPRAKEAEIYDFIASEMDAIIPTLGNEDSKTRANQYTALALKSRAMLYAASIAKYNNLMPQPVTTPGGEVGIPASRADEYYQKSLEASRAIITSGKYRLYEENPDIGKNFYDLFEKKTGNPEMIFVKDFSASKGKKHGFAYDNIVRAAREDNLSSSNISPSLNLVECFDYLDGTPGKIKDRDVDGNYIFYNNLSDIFANKDARLYGTLVYPGTTFRGIDVQIQAGVAVWEDGEYKLRESENLASYYSDGAVFTGASGPQRNVAEVSCTGFYLRKFVSDVSMASTRGVGADNWWPWFRLGEIYLNAAEAAYELGLPEAKDYINSLREKHGGFQTNSIQTLTMDIIRNERHIELAFEDHRYFDLKRWRIAHEVWNGLSNSPTAVIQALYPYRVIGGPNDGKYIFERITPSPRFMSPRFFQLGNYYSSIEQEVINNNPQIIKNPFH